MTAMNFMPMDAICQWSVYKKTFLSENKSNIIKRLATHTIFADAS
jgi:hypothetical protein